MPNGIVSGPLQALAIEFVPLAYEFVTFAIESHSLKRCVKQYTIMSLVSARVLLYYANLAHRCVVLHIMMCSMLKQPV